MDHHQPQTEAGVDVGRRRFTRAGAAGTAVLGTLASKPVLATGTLDRPPYHCTVSGQMSGNLSRRPDSTDCKTLGRSPGYWKNHASWPGGLKAGVLPYSNCSFPTGGRGTYFGGTVVNGKTLTDAFRRKSVSSSCVVVDIREGASFTSISSSNKATLLQVLSYGGGLNEFSCKALGRATVASLLNSLAFSTWYPLKPEKVIEMFNAVCSGGKYQVNPTTQWDANQVQAYFESLYGNI